MVVAGAVRYARLYPIEWAAIARRHIGVDACVHTTANHPSWGQVAAKSTSVDIWFGWVFFKQMADDYRRLCDRFSLWMQMKQQMTL